MDANQVFSHIWNAFETGEMLTACAWCGRVQIDDAWLAPPHGVLAAIEGRYVFSHSICNGCTSA